MPPLTTLVPKPSAPDGMPEAMARHTVDGVGFTYISAYQYGLHDV